MEHGGEEHCVRQRELGVLARGPAPGEERLQRLRGELDDTIAVDPADPPALHGVAEGMKHAEAHRVSPEAGRA